MQIFCYPLARRDLLAYHNMFTRHSLKLLAGFSSMQSCIQAIPFSILCERRDQNVLQNAGYCHVMWTCEGLPKDRTRHKPKPRYPLLEPNRTCTLCLPRGRERREKNPVFSTYYPRQESKKRLPKGSLLGISYYRFTWPMFLFCFNKVVPFRDTFTRTTMMHLNFYCQASQKHIPQVPPRTLVLWQSVRHSMALYVYCTWLRQ